MEFFTVPTATFSVLYCFFIIDHDRRSILHFNVTHHPTSTWIVQQLREAFPFEPSTKFLSSMTTPSTARKCPRPFAGWTSRPPVTAIGCPWQNGLRSGQSAAVAANCWTASLPSIRCT